MKYLARIKQQIKKEQTDLANGFAKLIGYQSISDEKSIVEREQCGREVRKFLKDKFDVIVDLYPKEYTKKLRNIIKDIDTVDNNDIFICFKQILRNFRARLISKKRYEWQPLAKRQTYFLEYKIICETTMAHFKEQEASRKRKITENTTAVVVAEPEEKKSKVSNTQMLSTPVENTQGEKIDVENTQVPDTQVPDTQIINTTTVENNVEAVNTEKEQKEVVQEQVVQNEENPITNSSPINPTVNPTSPNINPTVNPTMNEEAADTTTSEKEGEKRDNLSPRTTPVVSPVVSPLSL